jgi:hypothetical protein
LETKPLAWAPNSSKGKDERSQQPSLQQGEFSRLQPSDRFGDDIPVKNKGTLRIALQNIGGFPMKSNDIKEDYIRHGLNNWDIDIFGLVETNIDWRLQSEESKLWSRTCEWWEHLHISFSHNTTSPPVEDKQFGGTAIFTINDIAHRVSEKGKDNYNLGRWSWTRFRGKDHHILTIITAYRPNPPLAGVMGVYVQHAKFFNTINHPTCPREAFLIDLKEEITKFQESGDHIILMLDGNEDMRKGPLSNILSTLRLREVILQHHGCRAPSTYRRNNKDIPIDGIWASHSLEIKVGGYLAFNELITGCDHRALWIDIDYQNAFGYAGNSPIIRPSARRLNNRNPHIRNNFNSRRKGYANKSNLAHRIATLENSINGELSWDQIVEYETIDNLRRDHIRRAGKRCRKFRKGNVPYSPTLQEARNKVKGWSLLLRFKKGLIKLIN